MSSPPSSYFIYLFFIRQSSCSVCAQWKMEHKSNEKEAKGRREGGACMRPEEDNEGRKPASQPASQPRMLETAGARAPDEGGGGN